MKKLAALFGTLCVAALAAGGDPVPEDPKWACCMGGGAAASLTKAECDAERGVWMQGIPFDPTSDKSPCDALPGSD